jgi:hypothetical protein
MGSWGVRDPQVCITEANGIQLVLFSAIGHGDPNLGAMRKDPILGAMRSLVAIRFQQSRVRLRVPVYACTQAFMRLCWHMRRSSA